MPSFAHALRPAEKFTALKKSAQRRIRCGVIYAWNGGEADEALKVECALCADRLRCSLREFEEHMEVWHSSERSEEGVRQSDQEETDDSGLQRSSVEREEWEKSEVKEKVTNFSDSAVEREASLIPAFNDDDDNDNDDDVCSMDSLKSFEKVLIDVDADADSVTHDLTESAEGEEEEQQRASEVIESDTINQWDHVEAECESKDEAMHEVGDHSKVDNIALENYISDCINMVETMRNSAEDISDDDEADEDIECESMDEELSSSDDNPQTKLARSQIEKLIELFRAHPRLWQQKHPDYNNTHLCRKSWHQLTSHWNAHCKKRFTPNEVRVRLSTLCQRYLKERQHPTAHIGFTYYRHLQFLDDQQTFIDRRVVFVQQNAKILETYEHYPLLWPQAPRGAKMADERKSAYRNMLEALKLCGVHLPLITLKRRLQKLRKSYSSEKKRRLLCHLEGRTFETSFKHFEQMAYLEAYIEPFECGECGKIYRNLMSYEEHLNGNHGESQAMEEGDKEEPEDMGFTTISEIVEGDQELKQQSAELQNDGKIYDGAVVEVRAMEDQLNELTETVVDPEIDALIEMELQQTPPTPLPDEIEYAPISPIEALAMESTIEPTKIDNVGEDQSKEINETALESPLNDLLVKVDCGNFSYDLKLDEQSENTNQPVEIEKPPTPKKPSSIANDRELFDDSESFARLTVEQTRQLIALYSEYPQLWDPRHLDYQCRKTRRFAWRLLTQRLNEMYQMRYAWNTLHRKLSDYLKYYKREKQRIEVEHSCTKWCFYEDFAFIDEVLDNCPDHQKTVLTRAQNLQIIEVYRQFSALWDTQHADYTKRLNRSKLTADMCARLKADYRLHLTVDKLKQRIQEFRSQYRMAKAKRLAAEQRAESYHPTFDYYEALQFLESHVPPFVCSICYEQYKKYSEYQAHKRKIHQPQRRNGKRNELLEAELNLVSSSTGSTPEQPINPALAHVCHICGISFTLRNNLRFHLKRHANCRTHACSVCPKMFFNSTALKVHERSHTKSKPYTCEQCGRGYVNASKLNQHLKRHRNQRDYKCEECGKAFYSAFERDRHVLRHQKVKDKECEICGKQFLKGAAYYTHMLLHQEMKKYACKTCGLQFSQNSGLYRHRKRYHENEG